jgi:hypothetical protein
MTARPTAEFQTHHDIDAPSVDARSFRQAWRVRTRLDGLLRDGFVSLAAYDAGKRWRKDWEMALERSAGTRLDAVGCGNGGASGGPIVRIAAMGRLRVVADAVGGYAWCMLVLVVAQDRPWTEVGRQLGCAHTTAPRHAAKALTALARHYQRVDAAAAAR